MWFKYGLKAQKLLAQGMWGLHAKVQNKIEKAKARFRIPDLAFAFSNSKNLQILCYYSPRN